MSRNRRTRRRRAAAPVQAATEPTSAVSCGRHDTQLILPAGEPDPGGLRLVTREWVVPLLVDKFLRDHGVVPRASLTEDDGRPSIGAEHTNFQYGSLK